MDFFSPHGIDCKHFNGYKPCFPGEACSEECQKRESTGTRILIVNLDAMGDVLMTTAQLKGIARAYPLRQVFWLTRQNIAPVLAGNPHIDRIFHWNDESRLILAQQRFDLVLNADKSLEACAFVKSLRAAEIRGFTLSDRGQIIPANKEAEYNYRMGLDDVLKFRGNTRTGQEILAETWKLDYRRDEYVLILSAEEQAYCAMLRSKWNLDGKTVVGFNTGCSELYPNKKMTVEQHIAIIERLADRDDVVFLLLGGPEDSERNDLIALELSHISEKVISTPTRDGLRRGICYESLADIVVTGDTYGMHLAIALKKRIIVWFGVSCWQEIDLYDKGVKLYHPELACSPCWQRECPNNLECISMINLDAVAQHVAEFAEAENVGAYQL